jgi:D-aspartate ligase
LGLQCSLWEYQGAQVGKAVDGTRRNDFIKPGLPGLKTDSVVWQARRQQAPGKPSRGAGTPAAASQGKLTVLSSVGAVILGGDYQGLAIARALGCQGIPVIVIDDEPSITRFSRYSTLSVRVPSLRDADDTAQLLLEIGSRHGLEGWVLYPTRDEIAAAISIHRAALVETFRVPTPEWETMKWAWDKRLTYERAEEIGVDTPRSWRARDGSELKSLDLTFPVIIKPAIKEHFFYATNVKAMQANTFEELSVLFDYVVTIIPSEEVIIQELIPGGGDTQFSYCTFFKDREPAAKMLVRRARQRPPDFARSSTCVETIDLPKLEEPSERFLRSIDYYGLAEIEYKFDLRDGRYKLLDVNARTWGSHGIGRAAGADFALLLFRDQLGEHADFHRARAGVRWVRLTTDIPVSLVEIAKGNLEWRQFLHSLRRVQVEAVFEPSDPLPALAEILVLPHLIRTRRTRKARMKGF